MTISTKQVVLASYPAGVPKKSDFKTVEASIDPEAIAEGEVVLKVLFLSVDPYMRARMSLVGGYSSPFPLNEPISGAGVGKVVKSKNAHFKEGAIVSGFGISWAEYVAVNPEKLGLHPVIPGVPLSYALNILGMTGLTAYFGLLEICNPKENEVVVVSTAAGAVGYVVGQLAKIRGSKVIGIVGSDEKAKLLKERFKFDEVINYKKTSSIHDSLVASVKAVNPANPKIDVYFDNVGGETLDAVLSLLNKRARVSICGQISQYNKAGTNEERYGLKNIAYLLTTSSKAEGFLVSDFLPKAPHAIGELAGWLKSGELQSIEDVVVGLDNIADAFIGLMGGENVGKRIIKVADE